MAARKHRPPASLAAVSFSCKYRTEKNAAPPATPTSLRSAGCTVDKQHHSTSASNSPHGQLPARLHCINIQPRDWETFLGSGKSNLQENCIPSNCRKPALPKIATRLRRLKTPHLLAATHVKNRATSLRRINIQQRSFEAGKRGWKMQTKRTGIFASHCGFSETLYSCGFLGGEKKVGHILKFLGPFLNFLRPIFSLLLPALLHTPQQRHKNV